MINLFVTIFGIVLAVVGFEFGDSWASELGLVAGIAGTMLSIGSAVWQYRETRAFTLEFDESDWIRTPNSAEGFSHSNESNELRIAGKRHGKGAGAHVAVYEKLDWGFELIIVDIRQTKDNTLIVTANPRLKGKVVVR